MKVRTLALVIGLFMIGIVDAIAQDNLKQLEWMVGNWNQETQTNGYSVTENWKMVSPNMLQGESITTDRSGKIISTEMMTIAKRGDDYYFEAKLPGNKAPVAFKIDRMSEESFTCRNNRNVFPKQIVYTNKENEMTADLSGNGRLTRILFSKIEIVIED